MKDGYIEKQITNASPTTKYKCQHIDYCTVIPTDICLSEDHAYCELYDMLTNKMKKRIAEDME